MNNLTEIDKLKYWIDSEFSVLHIMFGIIMLQLTHGFWPTLFFAVYTAISVLYTFVRLAYVASFDKNYLKVPKK